MPANEPDDAVGAYVADYLDSIEFGTPLPDKSRLSSEELAEAAAIIDALGDGGADDEDVIVPPLDESPFAIARGIARTPPAVVIDGAAVRRAREEAGLTEQDVAAAMSDGGFTTDVRRVSSIENNDATALSAREARRLAATVGVDVPVIETRCEPWPASEKADFDLLAGDLQSIHFGDSVALLAEVDTWLGVMRCDGAADSLDSLTVRRAAADMLHGAWGEMHGVAVVSASRTSHHVVVLDAFDCDARFGSPNGEWGFAYVEPATSVAVAVADFVRRFGIEWHEPAAYALTRAVDWTNLIDTTHVDAAIADASKNINRLHEPKRTGVRDALDALGAAPAAALHDAARRLTESDTETAASLIDALASTG